MLVLTRRPFRLNAEFFHDPKSLLNKTDVFDNTFLQDLVSCYEGSNLHGWNAEGDSTTTHEGWNTLNLNRF